MRLVLGVTSLSAGVKEGTRRRPRRACARLTRSRLILGVVCRTSFAISENRLSFAFFFFSLNRLSFVVTPIPFQRKLYMTTVNEKPVSFA